MKDTESPRKRHKRAPPAPAGGDAPALRPPPCAATSCEASRFREAGESPVNRKAPCASRRLPRRRPRRAQGPLQGEPLARVPHAQSAPYAGTTRGAQCEAGPSRPMHTGAAAAGRPRVGSPAALGPLVRPSAIATYAGRVLPDPAPRLPPPSEARRRPPQGMRRAGTPRPRELGGVGEDACSRPGTGLELVDLIRGRTVPGQFQDDSGTIPGQFQTTPGRFRDSLRMRSTGRPLLVSERPVIPGTVLELSTGQLRCNSSCAGTLYGACV